MSFRLEECKDGSHTLFSEQFGQFYHNPNGAVAESWHVFFDQSDLRERLKSGADVRILEVGFGTGLNLLLLCDLIAELGSTSLVLFQSVEAWPVGPEIAAKFNYGGFLKSADESEALVNVFRELSQGPVDVDFTHQVHVRIHRGLFASMMPIETRFQYVFHDAFSPGVNAELWTPEVFNQIYDWCDNGATLTTYCAATKARNAMNDAGWMVTKAPGALGKREMSVARKII
jgi:tRNA U34 5-methylaminomethyl-2-thiouridine-forming methyltransferase MnmC